jgi:ribonuclease HII
LNDSKKLTAGQRDHLREVVEKEAISWSVASLEAPEIDRFNILNATFMAMHKAIRGLHSKPEALLIDGNRFLPFPGIPHTCLVKGDSRFASIAAASVLAKTHRDACMLSWHSQYPGYHWDENKGYPTTKHREAIKLNGTTPLHRQSFKLLPKPAVPALR